MNVHIVEGLPAVEFWPFARPRSALARSVGRWLYKDTIL
jgi:hypothetical protein